MVRHCRAVLDANVTRSPALRVFGEVRRRRRLLESTPRDPLTQKSSTTDDVEVDVSAKAVEFGTAVTIKKQRTTQHTVTGADGKAPACRTGIWLPTRVTAPDGGLTQRLCADTRVIDVHAQSRPRRRQPHHLGGLYTDDKYESAHDRQRFRRTKARARRS